MAESDETGTAAASPAHSIEVGAEPLDRPARNSVGGRPFLDDGQQWPKCFCGDRMSLFFQLDIPLDIEHFGGDHLLLFHCRKHNEPAQPPLADGRLVPRYWDAPQPPYPGPFWRLLLQRHATLPAHDAEPTLTALPLTLRPFVDTPDSYGDGAQGFKIGGSACWAQEPELYTCACGADLVFVCQVPENMEFGQDTDALFLGNENYLLACPSHCDPAALWPVNQN